MGSEINYEDVASVSGDKRVVRLAEYVLNNWLHLNTTLEDKQIEFENVCVEATRAAMEGLQKYTEVSKWPLRFLSLADSVAGWSKDPSSKVGAVLVSPDRSIVIPGYNGLPRGIDDSTDRLLSREWKMLTILHAEHNAILTARQDVSGWSMYVTHHPCSNCASVMVQSGIAEVHYRRNMEFEERWKVPLAIAKDLFSEAGTILVGH